MATVIRRESGAAEADSYYQCVAAYLGTVAPIRYKSVSTINYTYLIATTLITSFFYEKANFHLQCISTALPAAHLLVPNR